MSNARLLTLTAVALIYITSFESHAHPKEALAGKPRVQTTRSAVKSKLPLQKITAVKLDDSKGPVPRALTYPSDARMPRSERIPIKRSGSRYLQRTSCSPDNLALRIRFSDYTIDRNGSQQRDGGWTPQEREVYTGFLCKMIPIIEQLYGPPFENYPLTLVRDLYNTSSSVFVPRERAIYTSPSWNPQLLTHELVHAFRGDWHLTTSDNYWRYSPKLSGYEEGFAQAVSYDAMNLYLDTWGADQYLGQSWNRVWVPESSWNYDFKNDSSMITEDFWSDLGGTRKYHERYEQAAAAIQQLSVRIPDFYRRFNQAYYDQIRRSSNFRPTKEIIDTIIQSLAGDEIGRWLARQKILECRVVQGKKVWITNTPTQFAEPFLKIHFVETFPNGYDWYHSVPARGYLYHRLNRVTGSLEIRNPWDLSLALGAQLIAMRDQPQWSGSQPACGINCAAGFGSEQVLLHTRDTQFPPSAVLPIRQPVNAGLYELSISYRNPHLQNPPQYGIAYDAFQTTGEDRFYQLLGLTAADWRDNNILGGVLGLPGGSGTITISREDSPAESITVPVIRGAFRTPGHPTWFGVIRNGAFQVNRPGIINFMITADNGRAITERRFVGYGNFGGKHKFLFNFPCAADFNQDGGINSEDTATFFAAWESGESAADINLDGGVDGDDVSRFYELWEAGGC